jgi:hypothetical protein
MEQHNKTYGFVIAIKELVETVPNLFRYASAYKRQNNFKSKGLWEMFLKEQPKEEKPKPVESSQSLPDEVLQMDPVEKEELPEVDPEGMEGETYNMCHFWSNFEIARLDFFRSKEYEDFFNMMDRSGGFWAERVRPLFCGVCVLMSSGATHRSIHWEQEFFCRLQKSIISEISDINIPISNIVPPMLRKNNSLDRHSRTKTAIRRKETGIPPVKAV